MFKKFVSWMKQTAQKGASVIEGVSEMVVGVVGLIVVEAFVSPQVLTGTDTASTIAKVVLPLALVAMIVFGAFETMKSRVHNK